ncbi:MAG: hypothetical protein WA777_15730, partial [Rhodanobacter sp.]
MSTIMDHVASNQAAASLTRRPQWRALEQHFETLGSRHLRELFAQDSRRGERLNAEAVGLYLDYS